MPNNSAHKKSWTRIGEADYRQGAIERIGEAYILLREEKFAGSVYLAGRGAEGALRAVLWKADSDIRQGKKSLDTGHNLRQLLTNIGNLGVLRAGGPQDSLTNAVQRVARLWRNDMRFVSTQAVESRWHKWGEIDKKHTRKVAATEFYNACSEIIKRCEALCQKSKTP